MMAAAVLLAIGAPARARPGAQKSCYDYFHDGSRKYVAMDSAGAIADLEKAVSLNPALEAAKGLLIIILGEEALLHYKDGDFDAALPFLNKLIRYMPDDREIRSIYAEARRHVEKEQESAGEVVSVKERRHADFLQAWRNYLRIKAQGYSLADRLTFLHKISVRFQGTGVDARVVEEEIAEVTRLSAREEGERNFNQRFNAGLRHYKRGQFTEAIAVWETLREQNPDHAMLRQYITRARADRARRIQTLADAAEKAREQGRWLDAIRNWELILALDRADTGATARITDTKKALTGLFDEGVRFYRQGLHHKAIAQWREVLRLHPGYPGADASIERSSQELKLAQRDERMNTVDQYLAEAGRALSRTRLVEGVSLLRKALDIDSTNQQAKSRISAVIDGLVKRGRSLFDAGKYQDARREWEILLKIEPGNARARKMYDRCLRGYEESENQYLRQGEDAYNAGRYLEALAHFKKVLAAAPANTRAFDLLVESYLAQGIIYYRTEQLDHAIAQWDEVLRLRPDNAKAKTYRDRAVTKLESIKKLEQGR